MSKVKMGLAVIAVAVGVGVFGVSPASATGCPSGYACVWDDVGYVTQGSTNNYLGNPTEIRQFSAHNYLNTGEQVHDNSSSLRNNGNFSPATFYVDSFFGGANSTYQAGDGNANLGPSFDNMYDSLTF